MKFFINPGTGAYLRGLATEFNESTNAIRVELNRLEEAKILKSKNVGRIIEYCANEKHALFTDIHNVVKKYVGLDQLIDELVSKLGNIHSAYITGDYAEGIDSGLIDLILVGNVNEEKLKKLL